MAPLSASSSSSPGPRQQQAWRRLDSSARCDALRQATEHSCFAVPAAARLQMMAQKGRHTAGRRGQVATSRCPRIASAALCVDPERPLPCPAASTSAAGRVLTGGGGGAPAAGATHVSRRPLDGAETVVRRGALPAPPCAPEPSLLAPLRSKLDSSEVLASRDHPARPRPAFPLTSRPHHLCVSPPRPRWMPLRLDTRWTLLAAGLVLLHLLSGVPAARAQVQGESMRCHQEGAAIPVPPEVEKDNPCISCSCQNKIVVCRKQPCPSLEGCYWKMTQEPRQCCQQCKGCIHEDVWHPHGARWAQNASHYHCLAGVLTKTETHCHLPCDSPVPARDGAFCQSCPGCWLEGRRVLEGETVASRADPCVSCTCSGDRLTCQKRACPVLSCPPTRRVMTPGSCCMTCQGSRGLITPPGERCFLAGFLYTTGMQRTLDHCTTCTCHKSYITCERTTCPVLNCPREDQMTPEDECCPVCVKRPYSGKTENCTIHGMTRRNGEQWQLDRCATCTCENGSVVCEFMKCPYMNKPCPPGYRRVESEDECCPRCEEAPGVCVVFGDPHYRTFDGMLFNFQGACKYTLAETCRGVPRSSRFSLKVNNDARRSNNFSWTKSLTLRLPNAKVKLCQKLRVKVNGTVVKPPFEAPGIMSLKKEGRAVTLATPEGVRVLWDGLSYVEVEVPRSMQGHTCGLCGNYNGNETDDMVTKKGVRVDGASQMAVSWAVGRARKCSLKMNRHNAFQNGPRARPQRLTCSETHRLGQNECGLLNSTVFQACHAVVPLEKFYESCMLDMCECKPPRRCECDTLQAYARQCQRVGIEVQEWRKISGCGGLKCPHGARYMDCAPSCRATCRNPTPNPKCHKKRCRPGCYCPPPTVLHRGACIPANECRRGKRRRRNRRRNR